MINNSRQKILDTSLTLFSEKGYEGAGISEIVEIAGITKPTLYYFFKSKQGLFEELLRINFDALFEKLTLAAVYVPDVQNYEKDIKLALVNTVLCLFDFAKSNKEFYIMMMSLSYSPITSTAFTSYEPFMKKQYQIIFDMFYDISKYHGNISGKEKVLATSFISIVNTYISFWYQDKTQLNAGLAAAITRQFMHGIFI